MNKVGGLFAIGCLPFQGDSVGFALPILRSPASPRLNYAQEVDELTGKISRFVEIDDTSGRVLLTNSELVVNIGDEQVLAFITEEGHCHIGTAEMMSPALRSFASRFPSRHSIVLQIAELIGKPQEKKQARLAMRGAVARVAGARSARAYYEGSALRSAVWANLLAAAPSAEIARRILSVRARLGASVNAHGNLELHLDALDPSDRVLIDEENLKRAILTEFALVGGESDRRLPTNGDADSIQTGNVRELLNKVRHAPRQEERIAILINGILENKDVGVSAFLQYGRDRAKFANSALEKIREYLTDPRLSGRNLELSAAKLVADLYIMQYPANRGAFIFYFAKNLSKWPYINEELRARLDRTRSIFVEYFRPSIEKFMGARYNLKESNSELPLFSSRSGDDPSKSG